MIALVDSVPLDISVSDPAGKALVLIPLAISEDGRHRVALEVRLWPGHWHGVPMHEFKFAIVVEDKTTNEIVELFDRYEASQYVKPVKRWVMPCVVAAAKALIGEVCPEVVYRGTYLTRPSGKMLIKHDMITKTLEDAGYISLVEDSDSHGRRFWLMQRSERSDE